MWQLEIGSNTFSNTGTILEIDGLAQVVVEQGDNDGQCLLTADIYDSAGAHVAKLRRNAWAFNHGDDLVLDTAPEHLQLTNQRTGEVVLRVEVIDRDHIRVPDAHIYGRKGTLVVVTPDAVTLPGNVTLSRNRADRAGHAGISVNSPAGARRAAISAADVGAIDARVEKLLSEITGFELTPVDGLKLRNQQVFMDGRAWSNCDIEGCEVIVLFGLFTAHDMRFDSNKITYGGPAEIVARWIGVGMPTLTD